MVMSLLSHQSGDSPTQPQASGLGRIRDFNIGCSTYPRGGLCATISGALLPSHSREDCVSNHSACILRRSGKWPHMQNDRREPVKVSRTGDL